MVDRRIIEEWLVKADEDFGFASSLLDESPYYAQLCFHYQQAAEKYLKAFIVARELEFRKIHDLLELLDICHMKDASLYEIKEACIYLRAFYIDTRYPVHWPTSYTKDDALKARDAAARIQKAVKSAVI
jgi:HEPN domain-containing protein